ncbi:MAG: hypothetical protein QX198_10595 [Methylococcaceae bacterium]
MYYMMACYAASDNYPALITYIPDEPCRSWMLGSRFNPPILEPVVAKVKFKTKSVMLEMFNVPVPLMTHRLYRTLLNAGVCNIDVYTANITDKDTGETYEGYVAFNIIGAISAADLSKSVFEAPDGFLVSIDFTSLTIDQRKPRGAMLFRLAESVNGIVVHESVKNAIEAAGIDTLTFIPPEKWIS